MEYVGEYVLMKIPVYFNDGGTSAYVTMTSHSKTSASSWDFRCIEPKVFQQTKMKGPFDTYISFWLIKTVIIKTYEAIDH